MMENERRGSSFRRATRKAMENPNFSRLFLVSLSFLGMYVALYSAQNLSADLFSKDGFNELGNYAVAVAYLSEGLGSIFCVFIIMKYGATKSMSRFALLSIPFIASLIFPALKSQNKDSTSFIYSQPFVYIVVLLAAAMNGFGAGMA